MNLLNKLFCNHRHNINSHASCFASGNVNALQAKALEDEYGKPWFQLEDFKVGYLDIEADGLKVDFATMLSWCIKERGGNTQYDMITREELFNGTTDQRIVASCIEAMSKYKIIVTYFGTIYDLTFLRAKSLHYDMWFPGYVNEEYVNRDGVLTSKSVAEIYHFDLYYVAKSKLASLSSKSLANVTDYLHIDGKTPLNKEFWRKGKYGDPEALAQILEHNIGDVEILEQLHDKLTPFSKFTKKSI